MKNLNVFTQHPQEVRMTYLQHTRFALMLSRKTFVCAVCSLVHAFFPFLFVTHTSTTIRKLQDIFDQREQELKKLSRFSREGLPSEKNQRESAFKSAQICENF